MFPLVGGWTFEVPLPPSRENRRSDATPTADYEIQTETVGAAAEGTDSILAFNIKGDGRDDVKRYAETAGIRARLYAFAAPPSQGVRAIRGPENACAFALALPLDRFVQRSGFDRHWIYAGVAGDDHALLA
jgi:hypothetical protein